jgi:subtilisin family serine protease
MSKIRVLIAISGDSEAKRVSIEASMAADAGDNYQSQFSPQTRLPGVQIDPDFVPIPLQSIGRTPVIAMSTPQAATTHILRGEMDYEGVAAVNAITNVNVFSDPTIAPLAAEGCGNAPIGTVANLRTKINAAALAARNLTGKGVHVAICDTGINKAHLIAKGMNPKIATNLLWSPPGIPATPGNYPVNHGTMCAHAALVGAPQVTLIDVPLLTSQTSGGSAMDGFLSDGIAAFSFLRNLLVSRQIRKLVVNNSWGMYQLAWDFPAGHPGRYADNPQHPFNLACGALARAGADIFFAAGNCGPSCPDNRCGIGDSHTITGANAHPDVTTVSGVSVRRKLIGYSSQGPGIPGMAAQKPDISAYTHYLGSEAFGVGVPDSGTSTASPVAAGLCAALRTSPTATVLRPADLARELRLDAISNMSPPRWNKRTGYGIINAIGTAVRLSL